MGRDQSRYSGGSDQAQDPRAIAGLEIEARGVDHDHAVHTLRALCCHRHRDGAAQAVPHEGSAADSQVIHHRENDARVRRAIQGPRDRGSGKPYRSDQACARSH